MWHCTSGADRHLDRSKARHGRDIKSVRTLLSIVACLIAVAGTFGVPQANAEDVSVSKTRSAQRFVIDGSAFLQFYQDAIQELGYSLVAEDDPQSFNAESELPSRLDLEGPVVDGRMNFGRDANLNTLTIVSRTAFLIAGEDAQGVYSPVTLRIDVSSGRVDIVAANAAAGGTSLSLTGTVLALNINENQDRSDHVTVSGDLFLKGALVGHFDANAYHASEPTRDPEIQSSAIAGGIGPDLVIDQIGDVRRWGWTNGMTGYSLWTKACNIGDANAVWYAATDQKPIIAQNMYRLKDGRLTQIGMSWVKHGFFADNDLCEDGGTCFGDPTGTELPPMCADSYSTQLNGAQINLGPRYEVNATTGQHLYPFDTQGFAGDAIYKRIQVQDADVDPLVNPEEGTLYFVEAHYVAPDDAAAGNQDNNASYAPLLRIDEPEEGVYDAIGPAGGSTRVGIPGIYAWEENDTDVTIEIVDIPGDRRVLLGYKVTDLGDNTWHYEYAIQNLNSDRSIGGFTVPALGASNIGFHDIDDHSGDGTSPFGSYYNNDDWPGNLGCAGVSWSAEPYWLNERANAIRWGSMFNFWFDSPFPPEEGIVTLDVFKPGDPGAMEVTALVPSFPQLGIVGCMPGDRAIDPRQPYDPDGTNAAGIDGIELMYSGDAMNVSDMHFMLAEEGGDGQPVGVDSVDNPETDVINVTFDGIIEEGAWTVLTYTPTGQATRLGFLPADVDGSGESNATDIQVLIGMLEQPASPELAARADMDRNGNVEPEDLLRAIDLLNGGGNYQAYHGVSLP
ncbi:MAG: dockerin type I domain-containing protein [Phycisphaerae bacterium]